MGLILALLAIACAPDHEWGDNGPCPAGSDRFEPGLEPEQNFNPDEETLGEQPCADGHKFRDTPPSESTMWSVGMCTPDWCGEGYEGLYCFTNEAFVDWFSTCDTCDAFDEFNGRFRTEDVQCDGRTSSVPSDVR
jgi:hypothetical protein